MRWRTTTTVILAAAALLAASPPPATMPAKLLFMLSKETTVITTPLLADGTPDYVAALNARYGKDLTADKNALAEFIRIRGIDAVVGKPELRDTFLKQAGLQPLPPDTQYFRTRATYLQSHNQTISSEIATREMNTDMAPWTADQMPGLAEYLHAEEPFLDLAAEASKKPVLFAPFLASHDDHGIELIRLTGWVDFGRLWAARAMLRAGSGDFDGAIDDITAMKRFGRLFPKSELITDLLGLVFDQIAIAMETKILVRGTLNAAQCARLVKEGELPDPPSFAEAFDNLERYLNLESLTQMSLGKADDISGRDATQPDPYPAATAAIKSIALSRVDWDALLRQTNASEDQQIAMVSAPTLYDVSRQGNTMKSDYDRWKKELDDHHGSLAPEAGETKTAYTGRVFRGLAAAVPYFDMAHYESIRRQVILNESMLTVLSAAAQSKAQTGHWPKNPAEFVPANIKEIPIDPFGIDNARLQYTLIAGHPSVFSVGPDHKPGTDDDIGIGAALPATTAPAADLP